MTKLTKEAEKRAEERFPHGTATKERLSSYRSAYEQGWMDCAEKKDKEIEQLREALERIKRMCRTYKDWTDAESCILETINYIDDKLEALKDK